MKSQSQTDSEILASAKLADVVLPESSSTIRVRHTRSVHPVQCFCDLCRQLRFENFSSLEEKRIKEMLNWYQ